MMAQVNAGRVRFVGRGEYNNSTQYYVFDLVSYNGNSYYAKVDTIGNLPTNTTYWQLVAEKGNVGPIGLTGNGISSITKTSTSGLVDTYTITFTNGNTTTFDVTNGKGIDRIEKTATVGNIDTYTIYFNDNSTSTFEVANGEVTKEELQEEVDRLSMIYNLFPTTSDEDTEMTLDGTGEVKLKKIGLKGNTSQETTTGKNLLNNTLTSQTKNGITIVVNEDKSVTLNGTATGITWLILNSSITLPAGTYTMSQGNNNETVRMYCGALNGYTSNGVRTTTISEQKTSDISINVPSGSTLTNLTFKPMVEVGSTATPYEPYTNGPAPNPDYPQDIQVVSGDNKITVCGKNILKYPYLNTTSTVSGVTFTDNGNGSITINGTSTSSTYSLWFLYENAWNYNKLSFELNPGTYTFKGLTTNKVTMACNFYFSDNSNESFFIAQNDVTKTITNKVRLNMRILVNGGTTVDNVTIYPQIEVGSSSSSFEPYNGNTYPINLPVENLFDDSTTTNILIADDGTEQVNSNIKTSTYIKVEPNTIYTCSSKLLPNKTLGWLKFSYYNASKNYLSYLYTDNTIRTITTSNNCEYIRIGYHTNIVNDVQFEVGSKANSYTPYGTTPIELCKINTYQDRIYKNSGKWYLEKNISQATLNNTFSRIDYIVEKTDTIRFDFRNLLKNSLAINENKVICNKFVSLYGNDTDTEHCRNLSTTYVDTFSFYLNKVRLADISTTEKITESLRNWLLNNPIEVLYVSTPTVTEITDTTLIEQLDNLENAYSYDTQTNITQTNDDMPFILDVKALMSLKNILN